MVNEEPRKQRGPAYEHAAVKDWYCTPNRSMYVHKGGAIARRINPSGCTGCLKKYQVRHPNLKLSDKLVRASGKLKGDRLDIHVCGKAELLLAKGKPTDFVAASPMKMCIDCGGMATLTSECDCGKSMADKNGMILINVSQYTTDGPRVRFALNMPGYMKMEMVFPKDKVKTSDLLTIRESKKETIAISVDAGALRNQLMRSKTQ